MNEIHVQSCSMMEVGVTKPPIKHPMAGMGSSAKVRLGKRNLVGYCSKTLFYQKLYGRQHDYRMFGGVDVASEFEGLSNLLCPYFRGSERFWREFTA